MEPGEAGRGSSWCYEGFKNLNTPDSSLLSEKVTERAALFDASKAAKKLAIQAPAGSST